MEQFSVQIQEVKDYAIAQLSIEKIPGIFFNGRCTEKEKSLYTFKSFFTFYEQHDGFW